MKIAIASVQVPFITGGAEIHGESLRRELRGRGHQAEIVTIPFKWYPPERILDCMLMGRLMDLTEVNGQKIDKVVALKFPAYYVEHEDKVCWILHQHRQAYELFGTVYGDLQNSPRGRAIADEIGRWDNALLPRARKLFTNSMTTAARLRHFNGLDAEPLYHPPVNYEQYHCLDAGDYVLYPGRFDAMKRQLLLVDALARTRSPVKAILIGSFAGPYGDGVRAKIEQLGLTARVICAGVVDEAKKIDLYAKCLAVYNGVVQEDYGYVTLEAFFAHKPVITHTDSGGPLEFVLPGENGLITEPEPEQLAAAIDELYAERERAREMGSAGRELLRRTQIDWDTVIEKLLS